MFTVDSLGRYFLHDLVHHVRDVGATEAVGPSSSLNQTVSPADLRERIIAGTPSRMAAVIQRAAERNEVDPDRLSPRIASLPVDLVRHDLILNPAPVPDKTLVEIVDRIFLPLVQVARTQQAG